MNWKKFKWGILIIIMILAIIVRVYRLGESATFFWDQAYDLGRIKEYFDLHKLSLIGPISEDGSKVYSSLYYYMLMPFAAIFKFSAISTTIGASFYGILTFILLWLFFNKNNPYLVVIAGLCLAIWFPLIETSRWAWNPNLIIFWVSLGLLLEKRNGWWWKLLAGVSFGLSVHQHYLALLAVGSYIAIKILLVKINRFWGLAAGFILSLLPFVVFDLTHPPGLFWSRILYFNQTETNGNVVDGVGKMLNNFVLVGRYYTHSDVLMILFFILIGILCWDDFIKCRKNLIYFLPWATQIVGVTLFNASYNHYFYAGIPFLIYWLAIKRNGILNLSILGVLTIGSLLTIYPQIYSNPWNKKEWNPNIITVDRISKWIDVQYQKNNLEKVNIAVLGSVDSNTYGWKYRSLLSMKKITFEPKNNYNQSDYLFVVSESDEAKLRLDPANEMDNFRNSKLVSSDIIDDSKWKIYLFKK